MIIKGTDTSIFTINTSLNNDSFNKDIIINRSNIFGRYKMGRFSLEDNEKDDSILLTHDRNVRKTLNYLYHVQRIGGGLSYDHMSYAKLTLWQHMKVTIYNKFLPWMSKLENQMKLLTITTGIIMVCNQFRPQEVIINQPIIFQIKK